MHQQWTKTLFAIVLTGIYAGFAQADSSPSSGSVAAGDKLFHSLGCSVCHQTNGGKGIGPTLKDVYGAAVSLNDGSTVTADEAYVKESILDPNAKIVKGFAPLMPSFKGRVSDADMNDLIAYLKSLSPAKPH